MLEEPHLRPEEAVAEGVDIKLELTSQLACFLWKRKRSSGPHYEMDGVLGPGASDVWLSGQLPQSLYMHYTLENRRQVK